MSGQGSKEESAFYGDQNSILPCVLHSFTDQIIVAVKCSLDVD